MALYKCTDCEGIVNTEAKACPHCGSTKPFKNQKLTVDQTKAISNKELRQFVKLGGSHEVSMGMNIFLGAVLVLVLVMIFSPKKVLTPEELALKKQADEQTFNENKAFELSSMCQIKIKGQLNDPDSADFGEYQVGKMDNGDYRIIQEVRAKNGFGGYVQGRFECKSKYKAGDESPDIYQIREMK